VHERAARRHLPELRAVILGDGPDRRQVGALVHALGLGDAVQTPGFVATEIVEHDLSRALCLLLPSRREGYGLVVVEAASRGTPSVVVAGPDNAAVELIDEGENGFVARSVSAEDLAAAIVRVHECGASLRDATVGWFARNARRLSLGHSLDVVLEAYGHARIARS
jgi:glycosyltransferase involved in cell wall biosynthesis